jgi:thioredoxin-like negative regulator of GroEL
MGKNKEFLEMKKVISFLFVLSVVFCGINKANSMTYEQAMSDKKPMAVLIYADWADGVSATVPAYDAMGAAYASKYNFTKINICKPEAKGFNKTYQIYPNLPYVLLFKDGGKISRYLKNDCVTNTSCFKEKLDFFTN